jgi:hypothetical protein
MQRNEIMPNRRETDPNLRVSGGIPGSMVKRPSRSNYMHTEQNSLSDEKKLNRPSRAVIMHNGSQGSGSPVGRPPKPNRNSRSRPSRSHIFSPEENKN